MTATIAGRTFAIDEATAARKIAGWWEHADIHEAYPASTETVVSLLRGLQYEVDEKVAAEFIRKGYITEPPKRGNLHKWRAQDIIGLATALEGRHRWQRGATVHSHKWSAMELRQHAAEAEDRPSAFDDLDHHTCEDLLFLMVTADDASVREAIRVALFVKLKLPEAE
jgi:hypothetical protein